MHPGGFHNTNQIEGSRIAAQPIPPVTAVDHLTVGAPATIAAVTGDLSVGSGGTDALVVSGTTLTTTIRQAVIGAPATTPTVIGDFAIGAGGVDFLTVAGATGITDIGRMNTAPAARFPNAATKGAIRLMPGTVADTVLPADFGLITWDGTYTTNYANNRFGGMIYAIGTYEFSSAAFGFNEINLFLNGTTLKNANGVAANHGSGFTLLDIPTYQADAAVITGVQHNGVRSIPTFATIGGGTLTFTNVWNVLAGATVNAGATVTNRYALGVLDATGAGAVTTQVGVDIANLTAGATNIGIRSAMATGTFIQHTGAAVSTFAGTLHMNNGVALALGSTGANRVQLSRVGAGTMRMVGVGGTNNEGLDWDFDSNPNNVAITSPTTAGLNLDIIEFAIGPSTVADGTNNWFMAFSPGLRATQLAGDYSEVLFTSSSAISVVHAISNFATWTVNAPTISLGGGSIVNAANVLIQTNMNQGTNRYGLLITSNPSGGTLNYALRCTAGDARFDGRVDINNGVALGGGAAATLGTIGGAGPTAAAQAQWLEVDIGTVAHWIPVWT